MAMQSSSPPIIAIAVIGIVGTALLLVSYYVFVIKCCLRVDDVLSRLSLSRRHRNHDHHLFSSPSPTPELRGLDEAAIRSIPILNFNNTSKDCECAVCLNEFQEDEKLRFIPQCGHVFHIDCIDIWLHNNANCPLCRTSVSAATHLPLFDLNHQRQLSSSSSNPVIRSEQDYVVIELGEPSTNLPRKTTTTKKKNKKKMMMMLSMGDEVIGTTREVIQPIRRSFSMDSGGDMQLFVAVQQIMQHKADFNSPGASDTTRLRTTFFSFGNGRDRLSRSAVQPLCLEEEEP